MMRLGLGLGLWNNPRPGGGEPTAPATSATYNNVTWSFYSDPACTAPVTMETGTTAEGFPFFLPHPTLTRYMKTDVPSVQIAGASFTGGRQNADGSSTSGAVYNQSYWANGIMENPCMYNGTYLSVGLAQGFDELLAYYSTTPKGAANISSCSAWDASKNLDPGYTGTGIPIAPGMSKSFVKGVRKSGVTDPMPWYNFDRWSCINVFATAPALGAYAPGLSGTDKTIYATKSLRNIAALGSGFTLPSGKPNRTTVTSSGASGDYFRTLTPFFGQNGEQRRRYMTTDNTTSTGGYSRDYSQLWSDYLMVILADGSSAFSETMLSNAIAFGAQQISCYDRSGWVDQAGAGQSCGHLQFLHLFGHLFSAVSGVTSKVLAFKGNVKNQPFFPTTPIHIGKKVDFPNENHIVFNRPFSSVALSQAHWSVESDPANFFDSGGGSEFEKDYETTSGIASFSEYINIGQMKDWPGGLDGSQVMQTYFPAALKYYDFYRTVNMGLYYTSGRNARDDNAYDALRAGWAVSLASTAQPPDTVSAFSGMTAGSGGFNWDYTGIGGANPAATIAETQFSMDGMSWSAAVSGMTGTISGLVPNWRYYKRHRLYNSAGWGEWSYNVISGNQAIGTKTTGNTTVGSRTLTITANPAGTPKMRVGDLVAGPGITPGTYIVSFGTGNGGTGTNSADLDTIAGTYNLSMPAFEAQTAQQYRMAPMAGMVTPTGTASGTVTWTTSPAIYRPTYSGYTGPDFSLVASESEIPQGSYIYCSMGIATGDVQAPTFQWKRDGVDISGATGQGYQRVFADAGKTLTCTVTSNGQSATTAGIAIAAPTYPSTFDQVTFDGANDWMTRTTPAVFTGAADSQQLTIAMPLQMLSGDDVVKYLLSWGDAAGTASTDVIISVNRTAANGIQVILRTPTGGTIVFNAATSAGTLNAAGGKKLLMISLDLATASYQIYADNTAMTFGTVTGTLAACGLSAVQRPMTMNNLGASAPVNAALDYLFVHPAKIDLSIQGNRDKFAATSAGIGNDGKGPFGVTPLFFMHGTAADWNAGTNWGSGGDVNMVGAVT